MSPGNPATNSCKLVIGNQLLVILEPPLSRLPGCLVSCRASHLHGSQADRFRDCVLDSVECCLLERLADHLPENPLRYPEDRRVGNSADHRAGCPKNHLEENSADNLPGNLTSCSVDSPVNHLHGNSASYLQGPRKKGIEGSRERRDEVRS